VHPHQAGAFVDDPAAAARLLTMRLDTVPDVRAVGEIGLDYHYDFAPRPVQQAVFRAQLGVARERRLPVVIHTREAEADTLEILHDSGPAALTGVFHCFSGDAAAAARALATGFYVSIPGIVSFPKAAELREAVRQVPLDRLLVETDSPYLAPVPYRGKRNEPAFLPRVVDVVADVRQMDRGAVATAVTGNARRLFGL
jgi:TatD DNase family protein